MNSEKVRKSSLSSLELKRRRGTSNLEGFEDSITDHVPKDLLEFLLDENFPTSDPEVLNPIQCEKEENQNGETTASKSLPNAIDHAQLLYEYTGCRIFPFSEDPLVPSQSRFSCARITDNFQAQSKLVLFVSDWTRLWSCLVNHDQVTHADAFALEMPLLYLCSHIFLSSKMLTVSMILLCYDCIVSLAGYYNFPDLTVAIPYTFYIGLIMLFFTWWGAVLVKGNFFEKTVELLVRSEKPDMENRVLQGRKPHPLGFLIPTERSKRTEVPGPVSSPIVEKEQTETEVEDNIADYILFFNQKMSGQESFRYLRKFLWKSLKKDFGIQKIFRFQDIVEHRSQTSRKAPKFKKSGELSVIGFKQLETVITKYLRSMPCQNFHFKPRRYTNIVLILSYVAIIAITVYLYVVTFRIFVRCNSDGNTGFYSSNSDCNYYNLQALLTGLFLIPSISYTLVFLQIATVCAMMLYGADVANALATYWLLRFRPLRRTVVDNRDVQDDEREGGGGEGEMKQLGEEPQTTEDFFQCLERDAYERYLIVHSYFQKCTEIWGGFVAFGLISCALLFCYGYFLVLYFYVKSNTIKSTAVLICFVSILVMSFLVFSLTYANSAIDSVADGFKYCGLDDYKLIGGREKWAQFVKDSPIYWYVLGFPITKEWLLSFATGCVVAIIGGLVTAYASNHLSPSA